MPNSNRIRARCVLTSVRRSVSGAAACGGRRTGPAGGREEKLVGRVGQSNGTFRISVRVPRDMVRVAAAGTGADLLFTATDARNGGDATIVVSVTVLPFALPPGISAREALAAMLRARDRGDRAVVEEFRTAAGHPAIGIRRIRPGAPGENGRLAVNTGQAQVLVVYREAGALGVVSGARA